METNSKLKNERDNMRRKRLPKASVIILSVIITISNSFAPVFSYENGIADVIGNDLVAQVVNMESLVIQFHTASLNGTLAQSEVRSQIANAGIDINNGAVAFSAVFDESVIRIGSNAFDGCTSLTDIDIPNRVENIGSYAFSKCAGLADIVIPASVKSIGFSAFSDSGVKTVTLPASIIEYTPMYANETPAPFREMRNLEHIVYTPGATDISNYTFSNLDKAIIVFVPKSVVNIGENSGLGENTNVYAFAESYTEKYVKDNGIAYKTLPTILPGTEMPPNGYLYLPYSFKFASSDGVWLDIVEGSLPPGLSISPVADSKRQLGEIFGVPTQAGVYIVNVRATDGNSYPISDEITFTIVIEDKLSQTHLDVINSGRLQKPLGIYDVKENIYIVDVYNTNPRSEDIIFDCGYMDYIDLWIDGILQKKDSDFGVKEGSTLVTVYGHTLGEFDTRVDHVIAAEFKTGGKPDGGQYIVAQNFRINEIKTVRPDLVFTDRNGIVLEHLTADSLVTTMTYSNNSDKAVNLKMIVAVKDPKRRLLRTNTDTKLVNAAEMVNFQALLELPENIGGKFVNEHYSVEVFLWDSDTFIPIKEKCAFF